MPAIAGGRRGGSAATARCLGVRVPWGRSEEAAGGESVSQSPLKDREFSTFPDKTHDLGNSLKSLRPFRTVPSRRFAVAPAKNIENNPMQSSRPVGSKTCLVGQISGTISSSTQFDERPRARTDPAPYEVRRPLTYDPTSRCDSLNALMRSCM